MVPLTQTGTAAAAIRHSDWLRRGSLRHFLDFTVTQEQFGVTAVTAAIEKAPGTPSAQFLGVLQAAVTTEFTHVQALRAIGATADLEVLDPGCRFDGGVGLFTAFSIVEAIEVSLYLVGITAFTGRADAFGARLCAEALGTEAEHRALAGSPPPARRADGPAEQPGL